MALAHCIVLCLCRKLAIREIQLDKVLSALGLDHKEVTGHHTHPHLPTPTQHTHAAYTHAHNLPSPTVGVLSLQFIDLCILLGCDYCDSPRGTHYLHIYWLLLSAVGLHV